MKSIHRILLILVLFIVLACPAHSALLWQQTNGPYGGFCYSMDISKTSPNVIYMGTEWSGMYISTNSGESWQIINNGLNDPSVKINDIAVHPNTFETVYIVTKGEGIAKTTNAGLSWDTSVNDYLGGGIPAGASVNGIAIDPIDPDKLYVATDSVGVRKHTNAGIGDWESGGLEGIGKIRCIEIVSAGAYSVVYAGTEVGGIWKSTDEATNWTKISLTGSTLESGIITAIGVCPASPESFVYAAVFLSGSDSRIYKTEDGGSNWEQMTYGGNTRTIFDISVDHVSSEVAYAATEVQIYKTVYNDPNWEWSVKTPDTRGWNRNFYRVLIKPGDRNKVYACGFGRGFYQSSDYGESWEHKNSGLNNTYLRSVKVASIEGKSMIYAAPSTGGIFRSTNEGDSWEEVNDGINLLEYFYCFEHITGTSTILAGSSGNIYRSTDAGLSWESVFAVSGLGIVYELFVDPVSSEVVYALTEGGEYFYRSTDAGLSWETWGNEYLPDASGSAGIATDVGTRSCIHISFANNNGIWRRYSNEPSWESVVGGLPSSAYGTGMFIQNYASPETIYMAVSYHLYSKTLESDTWTEGIHVGAPRDAAVNPNNPSVFYTNSSTRTILKISDFGSYHNREESGLETTHYGLYYYTPIEIDYHSSPEVLYAEVNGRGIWKSTIQTEDSPIAPSNLSGNAVSASEIGWQWIDNAYNELGFKVYKISSDEVKVLVANNPNNNLTTTTETGLDINTGHERRVSAYSSEDPYGVLSNPSGVVYTLAATPGVVYLDDVGPYHISITWEANGNPSGTIYLIQYSTVEAGSGLPIYWRYVESEIVDPNFYEHENLQPETVYYYRILAENGDGWPTGIRTLPGPENWFKTATPEPSLDVVSPEITYVRFNDRLHFNGAYGEGDIIYHTPIVSAIITDYGSTEFPSIITPEGVDISSVKIRFDTYLFDVSEESFSLSSTESIPITPESDTRVVYMDFEIPGRLGDTTYICTIEAQDKAHPWYSKGEWTGKVRVIGDGGSVIGDLLFWPIPYKPLTDPSVRISYTLSTNSDVTLYMYDISGQIVLTKKFISGLPGGQAGYNDFLWDGQTDFGKVIANGIYIIKIIKKGRAIGVGKLIVHD